MSPQERALNALLLQGLAIFALACVVAGIGFLVYLLIKGEL